MNKQLTLLLLLLPHLAMAAASTDVPFMTNLAEAQARASREERMYFVHFTATWCAPCQWMEQNTFTDEALVAYVQDHYLAVKIDFDDPNTAAYKKRYKVTSVPSLLIFNSKGVLLDRYETSLTKEELLQALQKNNLNASAPKKGKAVAIKNARFESGSISRPALIPEDADLSAKPATNTEPNYSKAPKYNVPMTKEASIVKNIYSIQVGVFSDFANAERSRTRMEAQFDQPVQIMENYQNDKKLYKVMLGKFEQKEIADDFLQQLTNQSIKGFVRNIEN
jgi:thioredoxin-related protein